MLANLLVVLGVLVLLHSASTYLLPNLHSRTWRRTTSGVIGSPTTAFSSSPWNAPKNFDGSQVSQPSIAARSVVDSNSPPKHIILNTLKTGMKLDGYVVSSTPYAAFIDAGVVRVSKGGSFSPVHAMLHKSDIPKEVLNSLRKGQHQFPSPIPGPGPLLPKNTPLSVFVKEVTKQTGRFTVTTDSTVTREDLSQEHLRVREEASERRRSRRLRRQLEDLAPGTTAEGIVDKVVDEGVLVTVTSLGSLNVTGLIRKKDMPQHLRVPEAIKVSHQNQLLQQDFIPGRPVTCAVSEVHPTPHTANVYNLKLTFEDFNGPVDDDEPVEDIFDNMTAKEQKAWLMNRRVEDLDDDEEEDEDSYDDDNDLGQDEDNERDDFEQDFGNFDQEVTELYEELLAASAAQANNKGKPNPARLLPVESVYDWDAVQDMISSGELEKADVDQAIRKAGAPLRGGTLSLAQFKDVVEGLQDKMYADEEEEDEYGSDEEEETAPVGRDSRTSASPTAKSSLQQQQKSGKQEINEYEDDEYTDDEVEDENEGYDLSYDDDEEEKEEQDREQDNYDDNDDDDEDEDDQYNENEEDGENEEEEEEQSFDEIVTEVFDELKNDQNLVPVAAFKAWEDVQDMIEGGVIRKETLDLLISEVMKSYPSAGKKNRSAHKQMNKKMAEPALTFEQFDQLVRLLDEMVNAQESAEDRDDREQVKNTRVQVRDDEEEDDDEDRENYEDREEEEEGLSEEEQDAIDAADAKEAFQELSKDGKVVTMKSLRAWDEIRDLLEEEILDQESLDVLIRTANGDLTSPMNLETFTDLLALINDAVSSVEDEDDGEFADYDDGDEDEMDKEEEYVNQRSTHSAQKVAASVDEREVAQRSRSADAQSASYKSQVNRFSQNQQAEETGDEEEDEEEDPGDEPSDEELEVLARQAFNDLLPRGRSTVPVGIFESWPSVQEEVTAGMLTNDEIRYVLKKVDPRNTHQLTFEQFTTAMDMLEMKIQERAEEMEQRELDETQDDEVGGEDENYDDEDEDYEEDEHYGEEGNEEYSDDDGDDDDHYSEDFDAYDDINEEEPIATPSAQALPSTTTTTPSSSSSQQSVTSATPMPNSAVSAKSVPSGPGVGFDQVILPATQGTAAATKENKYSGDDNVVQVPTSLEDTEKEIDQLMEEMTRALYDELRGEDTVLTVEKLKQWQEMQDIFNEGVVSKSFFDRAVKAAGASHTGPISWKQFGAVLDAVQSEAEKSYPDEDDDDDVDGAEDANAKEAHAKALLKVQERAARAQKAPAGQPTAATVAASLDEESTRKNDDYDFTKVFETLEEIEQKETGKRKSKKAASAVAASPSSAAATAATPASSSVSDFAHGGDADDDDEYPVEPTVDELAQETYDRLRGARAQPTVADLLHWEDIVELIDRRALTGEQLVQALTDAKIDTNKESDTVSLEQFYDAVRHIDQHIDFSKLEGPDLSRFDQSNMMIHGAGGEIDELLREQVQDPRSSGAAAAGVAASVSDIGDGTDDEPREIPAPTKRKAKTATTPAKEKPVKEKASKVTSKTVKSKVASVAAGAEKSAPVSGLPVEVVPENAPAEAETEELKEKVKKPRKSKKAAPVVLDTVTVEDGPSSDLEIKEMFAALSKGKGYVTEKTLRSWDEIQTLLQANLLSPQDLDYHLQELHVPASGQIDYHVFEKFVRQLDEVLIDENGDFLPPDQKHRAVNLEGVSELDE